ncbi:hypothetical protein SK128_014373 [Halocaridina rubra]|uniref:Uncharacterized protein n=1 Tax=Halocaridina rubra TaxID=373956 RepID=A0AAN8X2S8_HALRR
MDDTHPRTSSHTDTSNSTTNTKSDEYNLRTQNIKANPRGQGQIANPPLHIEGNTITMPRRRGYQGNVHKQRQHRIRGGAGRRSQRGNNRKRPNKINRGEVMSLRNPLRNKSTNNRRPSPEIKEEEGKGLVGQMKRHNTPRNQTRRERKRNQKKPSRRKDNSNSRKSSRKGERRGQQAKLPHHFVPSVVHQIQKSSNNSQQISGSGLNKTDIAGPLSFPGSVNPWRGSGDNQESPELNTSKSREILHNSTQKATTIETYPPAQRRKILSNDYQTIRSSNRSIDFTSTTSSSSQATHREVNHRGNQSSRKKGKSRRVKILNSKTEAEGLKTSREHQEVKVTVKEEMKRIMKKEKEGGTKVDEEDSLERENDLKQVSREDQDDEGSQVKMTPNLPNHRNQSVNKYDEMNNRFSAAQQKLPDNVSQTLKAAQKHIFQNSTNMQFNIQRALNSQQKENSNAEQENIKNIDRGKGKTILSQSNARKNTIQLLVISRISPQTTRSQDDVTNNSSENKMENLPDERKRKGESSSQPSSGETILNGNSKQSTAKPSIVEALVLHNNRSSRLSSATTERVTHASTSTSKNQSRSITREDKRRPPKSPLQIEEGEEPKGEEEEGEEKRKVVTTVRRQNIPPLTTRKDNPNGNFTRGIHGPRESRMTLRQNRLHRRRHRHRHRHRHSRLKNLGASVRGSRRWKRNILYGPNVLPVPIMDRNLMVHTERVENRRGKLGYHPPHQIRPHSPQKTYPSQFFPLPFKWLRPIKRRRWWNYARSPWRERLESALRFHVYQKTQEPCERLGDWDCLHQMNRNISIQREIKVQSVSIGIKTNYTYQLKSDNRHNIRNKNQRLRRSSTDFEIGAKRCKTTIGTDDNRETRKTNKGLLPHIQEEDVNKASSKGRTRQRSFSRQTERDQRFRRELKNLYDAPNVTYRCSPSHKYWLFASSLAMGIYPARVKVLQSGDILKLPITYDDITTASSPTATTPRHRSDIPPELEYPELGNGYDGTEFSESHKHDTGEASPLPSPPPSAMPTWPTLPSASPSSPPVRITSKWMEDTLAKVKAVVDSILTAIGSRETPRKDEPVMRIDVSRRPVTDVHHVRDTATGRGKRPGRRWERRRNGTARGVIKGTNRNVHINSAESVSEKNDNFNTDLDARLEVNENRRHTYSSENGDTVVTAIASKGLSIKDVPIEVSSSTSKNQSEITNVPNINSLQVSVYNYSANVDSGQRIFDNTNDSVLINSSSSNFKASVEGSGASNSSKQTDTSTSTSKQTLSSVTDLLFTVPNERVIKPAENSEVKSEIKSTEKLVRTALEDLLFRVPSNTHTDANGDGLHANTPKINKEVTSQLHGVYNHSDSVTGDVDGKNRVSASSEISETSQIAPSDNDSSELPSGGVLATPESMDTIRVEPSNRTTNTTDESNASSKPNDLILRTSCLPIGSIGRFKVQDVTYLVTGLGSGSDGENCWQEVTRVVQKHIKLPPMNHTTLVATTAFYFVAASANLIG